MPALANKLGLVAFLGMFSQAGSQSSPVQVNLRRLDIIYSVVLRLDLIGRLNVIGDPI